MIKRGYIYIMGNQRPTLYIGVTENLIKRVWEHKEGVVEGFTKKYELKMLLYYEVFESIIEAIGREKQLKQWNRSWKLELIGKSNPTFKDLYEEIIN